MRYGYVLHRREVVLQIFQGQLPCGARGLNGVISVHLHPFFVYTSSEYSGQCAHVHALHGPPLVETALSINICCAGPY